MSELRIDPYSVMVEYYDHWAAHHNIDLPFYTTLCAGTEGPVVELGVGHGRVAIPVAQAGGRVIGVDLSDAMRTEGARRSAQAGVADRIEWVLGDMRSFVADPPVNLVYCPARAFLHNLTSDDQMATLRAVSDSLRPGGRFVCNFFTPDPFIIADLEGQRRLQTEYVDERGRRCEVWAVNRYDLATQHVTIDATLEVYDGDTLRETTDTSLEIRLIYRYEFEHLLARAGFEVEALYGGFDRKPYGPGPDEMVWVARKS